MPHIQIELTEAEDALLSLAAEQEQRSKRQQLKIAALRDCKRVQDETKQQKPTAGKPARKGRHD